MSKTVAAAIESITRRFESADLTYGHGTDNAWDEAVALVLTVTGLPDNQDSLEIIVRPDELDDIDRIAGLRVRQYMPLPYLFGECSYAGFRFVVEPGVMIPRSPIGALLQDGLGPWLRKPQKILDLCCGSGCLGIIAAHCFEQAQVTLVELDNQALDVAKRNVDLHELNDRVEIVAHDVTTSGLTGSWDLILTNPPYVDDRDMAMRAREFHAEPVLGLAGGVDGLDAVDAILQHLPKWLAPGGIFVCEVGASAAAFLRKYPDLEVVWLDLANGGEGVFLLEERHLSSHTARR